MAELFSMLPSGGDRRQKAHVAFVIPPENAGDASRWPEGERKYLCGRKGFGMHSRTWPWRESDTFPHCGACRAKAELIVNGPPPPTWEQVQEASAAARAQWRKYDEAVAEGKTAAPLARIDVKLRRLVDEADALMDRYREANGND